MITWHAITSEVYYAAEKQSLSADKLYFLTDTHELYKGADPFTESCILYTGAEPKTPARGKIYINTATGEGKIYSGDAWKTVIKPIDAAVTPTGENPVNSKAVVDYVASEIGKVTSSENLVAGVSYTPEGAKLTVTNAKGVANEIILSALGATLNYDKASGALTLKDVKGEVLGSPVNLDLERFVKTASYDPETKKITLTFNDNSPALEIPMGDLVDTYTAKSSNSIKLTVSANQFVAEAIVSATQGNQLQSTPEGLFVAATDLSSYMKLVESASTTALPMLNAQGQLINGTYTPGGIAISESPTATVLATELAVNTLVASTKTALDNSIKELTKKVTDLENNKLDKTAVVAVGPDAVAGQAADAKSTYDALCWKTTL